MQFSLLNFPIKVQPFFFLVMLLLGMGMQGSRLIAFILAGFLHVLIHELGHALYARWYGMKPRIELTAFGGVTTWENTKRLSHKQNLIISLAGPLSGAFSGVAAFLILQNIPGIGKGFLSELLAFLVIIGIYWSIINLLPIKPLDGFHILENLIAIKHGHKRPVIALKISFFFAVLCLAASVYFQQIFLALFLGLMTWQIKKELDFLS